MLRKKDIFPIAFSGKRDRFLKRSLFFCVMCISQDDPAAKSRSSEFGPDWNAKTRACNGQLRKSIYLLLYLKGF